MAGRFKGLTLNHIKVLCATVAILLFYVLFILVILKEDGRTSVSTWPWRRVITVPLIGCFFGAFCFLCIHYISIGTLTTDTEWIVRSGFSGPVRFNSGKRKEKKATDERILLQQSDYTSRPMLLEIPDDINSFLHSIDVSWLELFHEICVFRSFLLIICYIFFTLFAASIIIIPCTSCNAPYHALAIALCSSYGVRFFTQEIGRAVQQECRDRSRMPSSA
eukprot:TRINITY_DN25110_c0_g1_i4.p1 TRINITY_DN25110_c0_g1~~TRINITY_DN25110_c0_g1_i4.p1  ORF type:complete len:220 (+),score=8.99 TRINITY_DN25110_c0_g1_i4:102-761(+)